VPPEISPYLYYEDSAAAMAWLIDTFGFEEDLRIANDDGSVRHGQLKLGDQIVMVGQPGSNYQGPNRRGGGTAGVHVYVDDVDAHYERARAAGAVIHMEPTDQPRGDRRYDTEDLEGHNWFFAQRPS
jgi:uncharacterized glyoxalase superfamily protein PhnB